jgi:hypothetical protein
MWLEVAIKLVQQIFEIRIVFLFLSNECFIGYEIEVEVNFEGQFKDFIV